MTQMCPWESTVMPPTWPRIQLFGNGFGQDASTVNLGISLASVVCDSAGEAIDANAMMAAETSPKGENARKMPEAKGLERPRSDVGIMASSRIFAPGFLPASRASRMGGISGVNARRSIVLMKSE